MLSGSKVDLRHQFPNYTRWLVAGSIVLALAVLLAYYPSLNLGFRGEMWDFVELAAKLNLRQYMIRTFDPWVQVAEYRPLLSLVFYGEFLAFRFNVFGYHIVRMLVQLANVVVLSAIVLRISKNLKVALLSGCIYGVLPVYAQAVFNPLDAQPEAGLFYLLSAWYWISFLQRGGWKYFVITILSFILALAGKETSVTLIATLFLVDRLLIGQPTNIPRLFWRYVAFLLVLLVYAAIVYIVQSNGYFFGALGYNVGPHVISNFVRYFALLLFPWGSGDTAVFLGALTVAFLFVFAAVRKPSIALAFLVVEAILLVAPYIWAPPELFAPRYLYLPSMLSAIAFALFFDWLPSVLGRRRLVQLSVAVVTGLALFIGADSIRNMATDSIETVRQSRVPFHDIALYHPSFPRDTYLYFIAAASSIAEMRGLSLSQYGENVTVGGSAGGFLPKVLYQRLGIAIPSTVLGASQIAGLRNHRMTYVYYFDSTGKPVEVTIQKEATIQVTPSLPVTFNGQIRLEGYEITANSLRVGDSLVLLLYWGATQRISKDYTVFVHFIDNSGNFIAGYDSQPRSGQAPTSTWTPGVMWVDPIIIPETPALPTGRTFRLEIGLYDAVTMERLLLTDEHGLPYADKVVIEPFRIE